MKVINMVVAVSLTAATSAFADDMPTQFSARKEPVDPFGGMWKFELTSKADKLEIGKLIINRGCDISKYVHLPVVLKYGQTYTLGALDCNPIEVTIETPAGTQSLTWVGDIQGKLMAQKVFVPVGQYWATYITSLADNISITGVTPNRGNCRNVFRLDMPDTPKDLWNLKFGQRIVIDSQECNPITLHIKTDQGEMDFDLEK